MTQPHTDRIIWTDTFCVETSAIFVSLLRQGLVLIPLLFLMHALFGLYGLAAAHMTADIAAALVATLIFCLQYRRTKQELAQTA